MDSTKKSDSPACRPRSNSLSINGSIITLDTRFNQTSMPENEDRRGTNNPEESTEWWGDPQERNSNNKKSNIKVFLRDSVFTKLSRIGCWSKKEG